MRGDAPGVGAAHRHARPDEGCTRAPARARVRNALRLLALGLQTGTCAVGTFALALAPTRELAMQNHDGVEQQSRPFPWSILMGDERKKAEKARLRKGVATLVATPGRACDLLRGGVDLHLPPGAVQAADAGEG